MPLPLKESRAVRDLAKVLYDFLPGSGSATWKSHVSFKTVALSVGVGEWWESGSKEGAIARLFERTLTFRRNKFEPLLVEVVRAGLTYRQAKGRPVTADEVERINGLVLELGFKFPDLWDPDFLASLRTEGGQRAREHVEEARAAERVRIGEASKRSQALIQVRDEFVALHAQADRQAAGLSLERILNTLFSLHSLEPREPFRVRGEQIDGSFELDHELYLVEAKWHKEPRPVGDLYIFREKIEGKSKFTRGVFVSISGCSKDGLEAITQGKQPNFFTVDGYDLMMVLEDRVDLREFLRRRQRLLAESGRVAVPFTECGL